MEKWCNTCLELKPLADFYGSAGMRDGHRGDCKDCNREASKRRRAANRQAAIERTQQWRRENPERYRAYRTEYNARPERKRRMRDAYYRRTFGISADEVDRLIAAQGGVCAICGTTPEREASWHVDHCHQSGRVRGVLCLNCNQGLGKLGESPELLERAAAYLRASR
jgi:hypothetical protein